MRENVVLNILVDALLHGVEVVEVVDVFAFHVGSRFPQTGFFKALGAKGRKFIALARIVNTFSLH